MANTLQTNTDLPATMRGLEIVEGRLRLNTALPLPTLGPGDVLIRTAYTALNRADVLQIAGKYPPPPGASPLPGLEVSGTIAAIGPDAASWNVGAHVCALLSGGGYAEYVAVPAAQVLAVPPTLTLQQAASLPEAMATAAMALHFEAGLQPGERVLAHGGTSGLGIILTQVARALGADVYATVGSEEKAALLQRMGITALNHRNAPFAEQVMAVTNHEGVDVIVDTLGGPQLSAHLGLLRRSGRMVSLAMMEGHTLDGQSMLPLLTRHLRWSGATLRSRSAQEKARIVRYVGDVLWPHLAEDRIAPVVDSIFPWTQAEKALARMQERLHLGKILLEVAAK